MTTIPILSNLFCEAKGNRNHSVFRLACHSEARRCLSGEESLCGSKRQPSAWLLSSTMQGQADLKLAAFLGSCVFAAGVAPVFADVTALMLLVNTFAPPFLMGYSERGAQLMRHILGFRQFLESTEQDRLDRLDPARRDAKSELSLLPYAVALDIRERWGDRLGAETMVEVALDRML